MPRPVTPLRLSDKTRERLLAHAGATHRTISAAAELLLVWALDTHDSRANANANEEGAKLE